MHRFGGPGAQTIGAVWVRRSAIVTLFISVATVCGAGSSSSSGGLRSSGAKSVGTTPVAVLEFFTSEACPSCPAAEAYFKELMVEARSNGKAVFGLSYHVDYWSPPEQRDPLSSDAFAQRQRAYAQALRLDSVYTPQMIVNGTDQFIGSVRKRGQESIAAALAQPARVALMLRTRLAAGARPDRVLVDVESSSLPRDAVVNVALVERGLNKIVRAGSRSQQREFENVVRAFQTVPLQEKTQKVDLSIPRAVVPANSSIIAFVQDARTRAVLGAVSVDLQESAPMRQARLDEPG